jgi:hypothetical protein
LGVPHDKKHRQPKCQNHQAEIEQFQRVYKKSTLYFVHDRSLLAGFIFYEFLLPLLVRCARRRNLDARKNNWNSLPGLEREWISP